jgi:hypothetical protein
MYIIARMRVRVVTAAAVVLVLTAACSNPLGRQYEYEEQLYLRADGAATVVVDASIAALVALRGAALDPSPSARLDRQQIRQQFEAAGCVVRNVGQPWRRKGRRFIQVRIDTTDVRTLSSCGLLGWSTYSFAPIEGDQVRYQQIIGAPAPRDPGKVAWDGSELVAFKLHLPSRITYQNVKRLDGTNGTVERGNILTWEQTLAARRAGTPIDLDVHMDATSILYTTLWLFAAAFGAAVAVLALIVWWTIRRGRSPAKNPLSQK